MFNRGDKIVVRALVALYSLRKHWSGPITFYVERPYPEEFDDALRFFSCNIVHNEERHDMKTLVRKNSLFDQSPYEETLWIDADTIILDNIDKMFDYLDVQGVDFCIPSFCGWISNGNHISKRINRFKGLIDDKYIVEALNNHPAINTGVLSFKMSDRWRNFVSAWTNLAHCGAQHKIFIPDEVACQILYPSMQEYDLKYYIAPTDYNVSPLHDHGLSKSPKIAHFHGDKHVLDVPLCNYWKEHFKEMTDGNIANINAFLKYADKRLAKYLGNKDRKGAGLVADTTIVTACDEYYVDILRLTFANWRKYKKIDKYPVIVFVHGMDVKSDPRLSFLRLPNVTMIPWKMDNADNHREEMLSAFVFGAAEHVKTEYWLKLDADSYATDDRPFILDSMKQYAFCGHKWHYSRPCHIEALDTWAKGHWKRKLRLAPPMIKEGKIDGRRFYHNVRRTISFIQLHKTKFTRFCVKLLKTKKLPAPTQDTYMFYVANRFDSKSVGVMNFKKLCGFTQGKGKLGAEHIHQKLMEVESQKTTLDNSEMSEE
jgi:hypothetical protein